MNINNPTTFSAPALVFSTSNSSGTSGALRANDTLAIFSTTVPTNISTSTVSASTGDNAFGSREDHVHGSTAVLVAATQAEMEAGSSTTVLVTPGRTQYHPGVAKVWGRTNTSNSLTGEYNMTGLTNHGTGDNTWTYDVDFSNALYVTLASMGGTERIVNADAQAEGSCRVRSWEAEVGGAASNAQTNFVAFGDQ